MLSALELHDRGHSVRLLDAGLTRPPASWAAGGILSPLFPWRYPTALLPLARHARRDYGQWRTRILAAGGIDIELSDGGMVVLTSTEQQLAGDWGAANGVAVEAGTASHWMPWLAEQPAVFLPQVARLRNPRVLKGLSWLIQQSSVQRLQGQVEAIQSSASGVRLQTSLGPLLADQVLIAAGAWSQSLSPLLASLIYPVKGQMLLYQPPEPFPGQVLLAEQGYLVPRADGRLLVGSTGEPQQWDGRPTEAAYRQLHEVAGQLWPVLSQLQPIAQWSGIRPGNKSPLPVIGCLPDHHERVWLNIGHFRNGLVCAPASARLIAELISGQTTFCDPQPYSLSSCSSSSLL